MVDFTLPVLIILQLVFQEVDPLQENDYKAVMFSSVQKKTLHKQLITKHTFYRTCLFFYEFESFILK